MSAIIYRLTNTVNQKTYIGLTTKTLDERWRRHINTATAGESMTILHRAIRKYGNDIFTREVLEETTEELLREREIHWIAELSPEYNMTAGGDGALGVTPTPETCAKLSATKLGKNNPFYGKKHSPETRAKIGAASRGRPKSAETRAKLSAANRGKTRSPETCRKISIALREKIYSPEVQTKMSAARRKSAETRAKMSAANRGKKHSPETRAKIGAASRGRLMSAETRAKMSAAKRNMSAETRAKMSASARKRHSK